MSVWSRNETNPESCFLSLSVTAEQIHICHCEWQRALLNYVFSTEFAPWWALFLFSCSDGVLWLTWMFKILHIFCMISPLARGVSSTFWKWLLAWSVQTNLRICSCIFSQLRAISFHLSEASIWHSTEVKNREHLKGGGCSVWHKQDQDAEKSVKLTDVWALHLTMNHGHPLLPSNTTSWKR